MEKTKWTFWPTQYKGYDQECKKTIHRTGENNFKSHVL